MTSWVRNLGKLGWAILLFPVATTEVFSLWMGWSGGGKAASCPCPVLCRRWLEVWIQLGWSTRALHEASPACRSWGSWMSYMLVRGSQREHSKRPELKLQGIFNSECHILWAKQVTKTNTDSKGRELESCSL